MKQVRIRVTCDACHAWHQADTEDGVETVPVSLGQTLDLCPSHRTDLAPLLALIAEWGAQPERASKAARTLTEAAARNGATAPQSAAVAPAQPSQGGKRRGGARARQRRANAQAASELAVACPLCAQVTPTWSALTEHLHRVHQTTSTAVYGGVCPVCAHETNPRSLGSHGTREHQSTSVGALFALADTMGDPHGVVAGRAAALASAT